MGDKSTLISKLKGLLKRLKQNVYVLYIAYRHPGTPWYAKAFSLFIVAYALSPIDIIPDVIPVLGYLDEAVLLPLGIYGALGMIPKDVLKECQSKAILMNKKLQKNWIAAGVIILIWALLAFWIIFKWVI